MRQRTCFGGINDANNNNEQHLCMPYTYSKRIRRRTYSYIGGVWSKTAPNTFWILTKKIDGGRNFEDNDTVVVYDCHIQNCSNVFTIRVNVYGVQDKKNNSTPAAARQCWSYGGRLKEKTILGRKKKQLYSILGRRSAARVSRKEINTTKKINISKKSLHDTAIGRVRMRSLGFLSGSLLQSTDEARSASNHTAADRSYQLRRSSRRHRAR